MGSVKYEVLHNCPGFQESVQNPPSTNTIEQYKTHAIHYGQWCKAQYGCRRVKQMTTHIQDYADMLVSSGKSAATIHTYIAACCYAWQVPLSSVRKPKRHCYAATRSRGEKAVDRRSDAGRDASPRLYDFACKVGIRRREYLGLRCGNFKLDESGCPCVEVIKGKGGKYQLQRILPGDVEAVRSYFNVGTTSKDFIFTKTEMENKIDLHAIRAEVAKRAYAYYMHRLETEPDYRGKLVSEIKARWEKYRGTPPKQSKKKHNWLWRDSLVQGTYWIRGANRRKAQAHGLAIGYDRLAVMAVSAFHLSHWRCDVTVDHYLLAV